MQTIPTFSRGPGIPAHPLPQGGEPAYTALVIEATPEPGPTGLPELSVAHYGDQNGDLMRDPEMCFELCLRIGGKACLDYVAVEQWSRSPKGHYVALLDCIGSMNFSLPFGTPFYSCGALPVPLIGSNGRTPLSLLRSGANKGKRVRSTTFLQTSARRNPSS